MHKTKAEIITIGDEILYGHILDTNSKWMSEALDNIGIKVVRKTTIGDKREELLQAFSEAEKRADLVLITGGLGPTNDDLTKPCLAEYFNCEIKIHAKALTEVTEFFNSKGRELTEVNKQQAALPICSEFLSNKIGTAPGMWFERGGKIFVSMPGIPREMQLLMTNEVLPRAQHFFDTDIIYHKIVKTIGIGESWLADKIEGWELNLPKHISLAYLPSLGQVKLRLTAVGNDKEVLKNEVEKQIDQLKPLAGKYIFGYNADQIQEVVGRMLKGNGLTVATAESCTGGYLAHMITSVPGSSAYFQGSVIPYHNDHKVKLLGVKQETLQEFGAVSEQTVIEMANGVRKRFDTSIGVSTSGIAGPSGGSEEKPVGTVWIAISTQEETIARKLQLWKDREINIKAASIAVLNLVRITLSKTIELRN
ncbi:MAG: competence/damage-inducible protein A [Bacteroidota bacterium]